MSDSFHIEGAPCADGEHHTSYMLVPSGLGRVCAFPQSNYDLTSAEHREWLRAKLAEHGLTLDVGQ